MRKMFLLSFTIISLLFVQANHLFACESMISGEVRYDGEKTGPVMVALFNLQLDFNKIMQVVILDAGPGYYEFKNLEDGTYLVAAFMDVNGDGFPGFIEPLGAHPKPVKIINASAETEVHIYLNDLPRGNGSISGAIIYNGQLTGKPHIFALGWSGTPFNYHCPAEGATNYTITGLMPGNYMIVGFLDQDGDGKPDLGEPVGFIDEKINLKSGENATGHDIQFFTPAQFSGAIYGNIQHAGTDTGTIYIYTVGKSATPVNVVEINYPDNTSFVVEHLAPGAYYVFAYLDLDCSKIFDPLKLILETTPTIELGEPYEFISNPVIVSDGQRVERHLILDTVGDAGISGHITYNGANPGFLVLTAAVGLSPTWLGLAPALPAADGFDYSIPNLDAGIYGVLGIMINTLNIDFKDVNSLLQLPIGFYTNDLVCVKSGEITTGIDFILQDNSTSTSAITGTITAPAGLSGDIQVFAVGISLTPYHHQTLTMERSYAFPELRMGRYLVGAFMDVNDNGTFDLEEPFAVSDSLVEIPGGDLTRIVDLILGNNWFIAIDQEDQPFVPGAYALGQNYPNPFNPATSFSYQLAEKGVVEIKIYNLLGHEIRTLVNAKQPAGMYQVNWDGKDHRGSEVASGVYLYCMKAGNYFSFKKMTLMR